MTLVAPEPGWPLEVLCHVSLGVPIGLTLRSFDSVNRLVRGRQQPIFRRRSRWLGVVKVERDVRLDRTRDRSFHMFRESFSGGTSRYFGSLRSPVVLTMCPVKRDWTINRTLSVWVYKSENCPLLGTVSLQRWTSFVFSYVNKVLQKEILKQFYPVCYSPHVKECPVFLCLFPGCKKRYPCQFQNSPTNMFVLEVEKFVG